MLHYYKDILGRDIRYIADQSQTSLSLACEAAQKALEDNHLTGQDIDMIICVSHTPEYVSPVMARFVVDAIDGKESVICFDMNVNCTGMLAALDIADKYFKSDDTIEHVLIVQGDCNSRMNVEKESPFFGVLSDIGCAVILKRSQDSGIRTRYFMLKRDGTDSIVYPKDGYSKPNPIMYTNPGLDPRIELGARVIARKLGRERLEQVKVFCVSQFAVTNCNIFSDVAQIPRERVPYIGDRYGYTQIRIGDPIEKVLTTVGRPIEGITIKIVDNDLNEVAPNEEGEILVQSDYTMAGYYKDQEATDKVIVEGWIHTGDLGKKDEEGFISITGRKKDIIIRGGENISPVDIESALRQCESIKDVVVVGVPDKIMGQEIGACIIVEDDAKVLNKEELKERINTFTQKNLAKHKRPKYIEFVEKFPLTGSGKIQKTKLAQLVFG